MKSWEILAICNSCGAKKVKRKSEYNASIYLCIKCFRKKRGAELGNTFGKKQKLKGKCKGCNTAVKSSISWCKKCEDKKKESFSKKMSGKNNPAWTGNSICSCSGKKTTTAKNCRKCSFKDGKRSGKNNGRYVSKNRDQFLENKKVQKTLSGMMSNVCRSLGIVKARRKTKNMLGYSWEEFKEKIESQFQPGMSWQNHGEWHIDHITPVSVFNANNIFDIKLVNALSNLQPMWRNENIKKGIEFNKTKVLLLIGASGSGKTWVINKLNSDICIDADLVKPEEFIYSSLNKSLHVYALNIGVSTFIKRYNSIYDIETVSILCNREQLANNLKKRGSDISERLIKRIDYINKLSKKSVFSGSSEDVYEYLKNRIGSET